MIQHHNPNPEQLSTSIHILDSKLYYKNINNFFIRVTDQFVQRHVFQLWRN